MTELLDQTREQQQDAPANGVYTVLARRYRSTDFDEVVGQEPIARTLTNAIARGRTAHAYLFTGTRGVGKTSMARIFAKAINAVDDLSQKDAIARAILRGEDIDVIEIDAASNTGVDNVRDLIANAGLSPARCPYKVYIIDEVHMLSKSAFNALLKIMEEPPAHVKFVLCTTEPHKVPATIQSRCQRFDFRNIPASKIAEHLQQVLEQEGIKAEEGVIAEVARLANGSMRDGLSILDRLIAAGEGTLTQQTVQETLGTPDHTLVANVVTRLASGDAAGALAAASELLAFGLAIEQAAEVLAEHLRNVLIVATCGDDSPLFELFGEARERAIEHAKSFDAASLTYMIALLEGTAERIKRSAASRALFDALIVRLALTDQVAMIPALLDRETQATTRPAGGPGEKKKPQMMTPAPAPSRPDERAEGTPRASAAEIETKQVASAEARSSAEEQGASLEAIEEARKDPVVARAIDLFNGRIVGVQELSSEDDSQDED